jgi:hypothetical protein
LKHFHEAPPTEGFAPDEILERKVLVVVVVAYCDLAVEGTIKRNYAELAIWEQLLEKLRELSFCVCVVSPKWYVRPHEFQDSIWAWASCNPMLAFQCIIYEILVILVKFCEFRRL